MKTLFVVTTGYRSFAFDNKAQALELFNSLSNGNELETEYVTDENGKAQYGQEIALLKNTNVTLSKKSYFDVRPALTSDPF